MARICKRHKPIILKLIKLNSNGKYNQKQKKSKQKYISAWYVQLGNREWGKFEMPITGEPKEPNLESFSLTWSANHLSVYNSSRPYRRVILQPVHLSGIRQSVCSHGTVGYLSSKVCLGMRQFFIVEIHNFPISRYKISAMFHKSYQKKIWSLETPGFVKKLPSPPLPREDILSFRYRQWKERLQWGGGFTVKGRYQIILFFSLRLTK